MTLSPNKPFIPIEADASGVPAWVACTLGMDPVKLYLAGSSESLVVSEDGEWSLVNRVVENANAMDIDTFQQSTTDAYRNILEQLTETAAPYPVRAWNAVPAINRLESLRQNRYMAFNAGRYDAYALHYAGNDALPCVMPTASAIGTADNDLTIHVLGHRNPGVGIENPRQVPAYHYSPRYGRTPPSFVRATVLPPETEDALENRVLVAGTASVVGEDSLHAGNLQQQLEETFRNLAAIVAAAGTPTQHTEIRPETDQNKWLSRYRSVRVYVRAPRDFNVVMRSVSATMPDDCEIELVHADICRPELLVEIEGVAAVPIVKVMP